MEPATINNMIPSKSISDAIGIKNNTLLKWMNARGRKHGPRIGYTYDDAFAAVTFYQNRRHMNVDYSKLPSDLVDLIISGQQKPVCRYCSHLMDIRVTKTDFVFYFRCGKCGSQSPVAGSRTEAMLKAGVEK